MQKGNTYETRTSTNISKLTEDIPRLHYKDKTVVYREIIVLTVKFIGNIGTCSMEQIFYSVLQQVVSVSFHCALRSYISSIYFAIYQRYFLTHLFLFHAACENHLEVTHTPSKRNFLVFIPDFLIKFQQTTQLCCLQLEHYHQYSA